MALPASGQLSFSQLQGEFGGANPISFSEYYRGGAYVPNGPAGNNNIATGGAISMGQFYNGVKATIVNQFGGTLDTSRIGTAATSITLNFSSDGSVSAGLTGTQNFNGAQGDLWFNPPTSGVGNGYYILATLTSGTTPNSGVMGTWQQLNVNRSWVVNSGTGGGSSYKSSTILFQISNAPGGTVLASGTFSMTAQRET